MKQNSIFSYVKQNNNNSEGADQCFSNSYCDDPNIMRKRNANLRRPTLPSHFSNLRPTFI